MEKLTRERAHDLCVEHWNDVAENGIHKAQSRVLENYHPVYECFACEFYRDIEDEDENTLQLTSGGDFYSITNIESAGTLTVAGESTFNAMSHVTQCHRFCTKRSTAVSRFISPGVGTEPGIPPHHVR